MNIQEILNSFGYSEATYVTGRTSIADLFKVGKRCGVYVLQFDNGEYYAGKTNDITRRYLDHRRNHLDIQTLRFVEKSPSDLAEFECSLIWALEKNGINLRNIALTSMPKGTSDLDDIMSVELQDEFIQDYSFIYSGNQRNNDEIIRHKNDRRVSKFLRGPFARPAIRMLAAYIKSCIPAFNSAEMSFWSLTCFDNAQADGYVIARINVFWQEIFNIHVLSGAPYCSIFLCRSEIAKKFGSGLKGAANFRRSFPDVDIGDHRYIPGGHDQINIFASYQSLFELLREPAVLQAMRLFALRLMRKGPSTYARSHCFALVDHVLREIMAEDGLQPAQKPAKASPLAVVRIKQPPKLNLGWRQQVVQRDKQPRDTNSGRIKTRWRAALPVA